MTNTPPPSNKKNDDATNGTADAADENSAAVDAPPVFDDMATEHAEVQDAAPNPEPGLSATAQPVTGVESASDGPVPLVEPATPQPTPVVAANTAPTPDALNGAPETSGYDEHIDEPIVTDERPVATPVPAATPMQTVYITAPVAPRRKGNRGFGLLFGLLALVVFAVLFVAIMAIVLYANFSGDLGDRLVGFISSTAFIVPLAVFIVAFAILVLLTNRAGWWAYVLGSFLVALAVYFGSIGVVLLTGNVLGMTADAASATFWSLAASPSIIIAGILAREVTIWFGAAIAARGRKVKERNLEAKAAYERELDNQPLGFS